MSWMIVDVRWRWGFHSRNLRRKAEASFRHMKSGFIGNAGDTVNLEIDVFCESLFMNSINTRYIHVFNGLYHLLPNH